MRSPLPELYGKLLVLYGGVGTAAAIFFHPGMLICTGICLFMILQFFNGMDQGVAETQARRKRRNCKRVKR